MAIMQLKHFICENKDVICQSHYYDVQPGCGDRATWAGIPSLLLSRCVTLNKSLLLSEPLFSPLQKGSEEKHLLRRAITRIKCTDVTRCSIKSKMPMVVKCTVLLWAITKHKSLPIRLGEE